MKMNWLELDKIISSLLNKMEGWVTALVVMLPNLLVALLVIIVFFFLARFASRLLHKVLDRVSHNRQVNRLLGSVTHFAVIVIGLFVALGILNLDKTVTSLLAGVGIIGLALGFAFQDLAANFMAGIIIAIDRPYKIGEIISSNNFMGTVKVTSLRSTSIQNFTGQVVRIPNKDIFGNALTNFSEDGLRRVDVQVGVSYADDLDKVVAVTEEAVKPLATDARGKSVEVFFEEFGGSSINLVARYWIEFSSQAGFLKSKSDAIIAIKAAFDKENISIPFPIRTIDFGIGEAGVSLQSELDAKKDSEEA